MICKSIICALLVWCFMAVIWISQYLFNQKDKAQIHFQRNEIQVFNFYKISINKVDAEAISAASFTPIIDFFQVDFSPSFRRTRKQNFAFIIKCIKSLKDKCTWYNGNIDKPNVIAYSSKQVRTKDGELVSGPMFWLLNYLNNRSLLTHQYSGGLHNIRSNYNQYSNENNCQTEKKEME